MIIFTLTTGGSSRQQMFVRLDLSFKILILMIEHRKPWIVQACQPRDSQSANGTSEVLQTFDHVKQQAANLEHIFQFLLRESGDFYIQTQDSLRLVSNNGPLEQTHWLKSFTLMKMHYRPAPPLPPASTTNSINPRRACTCSWRRRLKRCISPGYLRPILRYQSSNSHRAPAKSP